MSHTRASSFNQTVAPSAKTSLHHVTLLWDSHILCREPFYTMRFAPTALPDLHFSKISSSVQLGVKPFCSEDKRTFIFLKSDEKSLSITVCILYVFFKKGSSHLAGSDDFDQ